LPRAASLADELLSNYQHVIENLTLIPGGGGVFEVIVDDELIYSKKSTKRHAEAGEVFGLFQNVLSPGVPIYGT
jgi:selenoprotein W-related protein